MPFIAMRLSDLEGWWWLAAMPPAVGHGVPRALALGFHPPTSTFVYTVWISSHWLMRLAPLAARQAGEQDQNQEIGPQQNLGFTL